MDVFGNFLHYTLEGLTLGVAPTLTMAILMYLVLWCLNRSRENAAVPTSFTAFGTVSGILVGGSRDPTIGGVLPIVLPMVPLFITFIVEKKNEDAIRTLYMLSLFGFFLGIAFGVVYGAVLRIGH